MASVGTLDCCLRPYSHVVFPLSLIWVIWPMSLAYDLILVAWLSLYTKKGGKIPRLGFDQLAFSSHYKCMGASTMGGGIPCIQYMYLFYYIEVVGSTSIWERWHIRQIHCVFSSTLEVLKLLKCYFSTPKNKNIHVRGAKPKKFIVFYSLSLLSHFSLSLTSPLASLSWRLVWVDQIGGMVDLGY